MTETVQDIRPLGIWSRMVGVLTSPAATFANVVATPRPVGVLLIVALVVGISASLPQFTEKGQQAVMQMQIERSARAGAPMDDEAQARMARFAPYFPLVSIGFTLIFMPVMSLFLAAIFWAVFNVVLGGTAMFKQVLAIITHSHVVTAVGFLLTAPFLFQTPANPYGPFTLSALAPTLEEGSQLARFLRNVSVFSLWYAVVVSIGLAVLYRRKVGGILIAVLAVTLGLAYLGAVFGG